MSQAPSFQYRAPRPRVDILGVEIDNLRFEEAVEAIVGLARGGGNASVVTPNVDHIMRLRHDGELRACYQGAALVLADGMPILWASRLLGNRIVEKVSGSDLLPRLCEAAAANDLSVYFLGGLSRAAELCAERLRERFPKLAVAGLDCPPYGFDRDPEANGRVVEAIRAANPHILFVGLGCPKQEYWIHRNLRETGVPVALGVGASIDFAAGLVRRAPRWMQRLGLEWFYRLAREPRRLWKRYLVEDSPFVFLVLRQALRGRGNRSR